MPEQPITYFFVGNTAKPGVLDELLGRDVVTAPAVLSDHTAIAQRLEHLPSEAAESLREQWGEDFAAWSVTPRKEGSVRGIIAIVDTEEIPLLHEWELVETGWHEEQEAKLDTAGSVMFGERIIRVLRVPEGQPFDVELSDSGPESLEFVSVEELSEVARRVRADFLAQEGLEDREGRAGPL